MDDFRHAQATIQARNAEVRKHTFHLCAHCGTAIVYRDRDWVHVDTGSPWCGVEPYAEPAVKP